MEIYIFVYLLSIIGFLMSLGRIKIENVKLENILFYVTSAVLVLMVCFREQHVGADTYNYLYFFNKPNDLNGFYAQEENLEPGLGFFNSIIRFIWHDKYFYSFVLSFISLSPIFFIINKHSYYKNISLFTLISFSVGSSYWILSFSMLRQFLALGIWALVFEQYLRNDKKLSINLIILSILMVLIHYSSLMVILLFVIDRINISKKWFYILSIASCLAGYVLDKYAPFLYYLAAAYNKEFYFTNVSDTSFSFLRAMPTLGTFLLTVYFLSEKEANSIYIKGFFLAIVLSGIMMFFGNNVDRMCLYFYVPTFIGIPLLFKSLRRRSTVLELLFVVVFLAYFSYKYFAVVESMGTLNNHMVPYRSFLFF